MMKIKFLAVSFLTLVFGANAMAADVANAGIASKSYVDTRVQDTQTIVDTLTGRVTSIETSVGDLTALDTEEQGNLVGAINEAMDTSLSQAGKALKRANDLVNQVGSNEGLTTTEKTSIVGAINEVNAAVKAISTTDKVGDLSTLNTEAKENVVAALNEVVQQAGDALTEYSNAMEQGFKGVSSVLGDIRNLNTTAKNNLVNAINEVNAATKAIQIPVGSATAPTGYATIWVE